MISGFTTVLPPNSPSCAVGTGEAQWGIFSADSYHSGGVNTLLADGSVRFIRNSVDSGDLSTREPTHHIPALRKSPYGVWGALGSIDGTEPVEDF
jgi:prepilin-type processing-associated H-X9-DG protein